MLDGMKRTVTKAEAASALGVTLRTLTRWLAEGCPHTRDEQGLVWLNVEEARRWRGPSRAAPPDAPAGPAFPVDAGASAPPPRPSLETAELARRLTIARKNELELAAEKGLKDLGLDERIRAAQSHADLLEYTKKVIELVGSGAMTPERGRTLKELVIAAGRHMKARSDAEGDGEPQRLILMSEESAQLVRAFEGIVSDARRAELLALVLAALQKDQDENPNVDLAGDLPLPTDDVPPADELETEEEP